VILLVIIGHDSSESGAPGPAPGTTQWDFGRIKAVPDRGITDWSGGFDGPGPEWTFLLADDDLG
jgi:hypothetical protein